MEFSKIVDLFSDVLSLDEDQIKKSTPLTKEFSFEPIDIAALVIAAEKEFQITIHDEDVGSFKTVGDMFAYIQENLPEPDFLPEELIYETSQSRSHKIT